MDFGRRRTCEGIASVRVRRFWWRRTAREDAKGNRKRLPGIQVVKDPKAHREEGHRGRKEVIAFLDDLDENSEADENHAGG